MKKTKVKIEIPNKQAQKKNEKELRDFIEDNPGSTLDEIYEMFPDCDFSFLTGMVSLYEEGKIVSRCGCYFSDEAIMMKTAKDRQWC